MRELTTASLDLNRPPPPTLNLFLVYNGHPARTRWTYNRTQQGLYGPRDEVLARWPTGEVAIVLRGKAMHNATTVLPWAVLRRAAQVAGVHLYTDRECVCYTDGHFAVLHGIQDGQVTFTLPAPATEICDATNRAPLAEHADMVTIPLKFGETRILHWQ